MKFGFFSLIFYVVLSATICNAQTEEFFNQEVVGTEIFHAAGFQVGEHKFLFASGSCEETEALAIFAELDEQIERYGLSLTLDDPDKFRQSIESACEAVDQEAEAERIRERQLQISVGLNLNKSNGAKGNIDDRGIELTIGRDVTENSMWEFEANYESYLDESGTTEEEMITASAYGAYKYVSKDNPQNMMFVSAGLDKNDDIGLKRRSLALVGAGTSWGANSYLDVCGDKTNEGWWAIKTSLGAGYTDEDRINGEHSEGIVVSPWASYHRRLSNSCLLIDFKGLAKAEDLDEYTADFGIELNYKLGDHFYFSPRYEYLIDSEVDSALDQSGHRYVLKIEWKR